MSKDVLQSLLNEESTRSKESVKKAASANAAQTLAGW